MTGAYQLPGAVRPAEQVSYAAGDAGFNLLWVLYDSFLLYFLVEIARLPAALITPVVLCSRMADLLASVLFGLFGERVRTRYGSYRPYLFWLAPLLAISFVMLFTAAPFAGKDSIFVAAWTGTAAVLFAALYSVANAAYTALLAVLTADEPVRVRMASLRFAFAAAGVLLVQYFALRAAAVLGGSSLPRGWTAVAALGGAGCWAALWLTAANTRERLLPTVPVAVHRRLDLQRLAHDAARESGLGYLALAMVLCLAALSTRGAAAPFFIQAAGGGGVAWTGPALATNSLAAFLVCVAIPWAVPARWLSPIPLAASCAATAAVLCALPAMWGPTTHGKLLLLQAAFGLGTGLLLPTLFVLAAALPRRAASSLTPALLAAGTLLALKAGSAAGALLASHSIASAQAAGLATADAAREVARLFTVWPAGLFALTMLCLLLAGRQRRQRISDAASV